MPGFNGQGPMWGGGPGAGRGLGPSGLGLKRGWGRGFGRFFGYSYKQPSKKEELETVETDEKELEAELKALRDFKKSLQK